METDPRTPAGDAGTSADVLDFWRRDYEMRVDYLVGQFGRMWNRFQFLLGIDTALVGLYFAPLQPGRLATASTFAVVGLLASAFWYVVGAEDKYLVDLYRSQVRYAAARLAHMLEIKDYEFVGETDVPEDRRPRRSLIQWRVHSISITTLVVIFPILMGVLWLVLFGYALTVYSK